MTILTTIFIVLGLTLIGFLIAEFQNAYLGNQEKSGITYFDFIGVDFTQKDAQRLLFAVFLSIGLMFIIPYLITLTGLEINGHIAYIVIGYAPSTVMLFVKKKVKEKTGVIKRSDSQSTSGGSPNPDHEQH